MFRFAANVLKEAIGLCLELGYPLVNIAIANGNL